MKFVYYNLFESFDPSIHYIYKIQFNWMFMILSMVFGNNYWFIPSRINMLFNIFISFLFNEFSKSINFKSMSNIYISLSFEMFITLLICFMLFPYVFSMTSHLLFNLLMSLFLWLRFFFTYYSIIQ